ncbi:hypothetical protein PENSTE_c011G06806 [Penicillium steckii]|uniref:Tautomerase cis-CaaD-like domain-containing protein n=1 Tax=Penicillium steckii TaxID=303698 RepID=A0A1V6T6N8_9EURO|nr:hypothetical protein PENSTE_c011G06806 [Penicillium steckii]
MPKLVFNHAAGIFTNEEKSQIAQKMTKIYTSVGLPAFYCHTQFFELPPNSMYAGGETQTNLTTLSIYHIARGFPTKEVEYEFFQNLDDILRPILKPKNVDWELGIYEASRDLWRVNGLMAPETGSVMEKEWFDANGVVDEEVLLRERAHA